MIKRYYKLDQGSAITKCILAVVGIGLFQCCSEKYEWGDIRLYSLWNRRKWLLGPSMIFSICLQDTLTVSKILYCFTTRSVGARCRKDHVKSCLPDRTLTPLYRCNVNKILFQMQPMGSVPTIPKISYRGVHVMYVRDVCCKGTSCPRQPSRLQELEESKCVLSV